MTKSRAFGAATAALFCAAGLSLASPASACTNITAVGNFPTDDALSAVHTENGATSTYKLITTNEHSSGGIPGLIEFCVYPDQPPGNPTTVTVANPLKGADGSQWTAATNDKSKAAAGYFEFKRPHGDPTNLPFDGSTYKMGSATWGTAASPINAPTKQTILLHVNDPAVCAAQKALTCWVYPGTIKPPNVVCNGAPACKQVTITPVAPGGADTNPIKVPGKTLLHIHYLYTIVNQQPTGGYTMDFKVPTLATKDINAGGAKDYFGCEQIPNTVAIPGYPAAPGGVGSYPNYQSTGLTLNFTQGAGGGCHQSRFTLTWPGAAPPPYVFSLSPGKSASFTVDMVTRVNAGSNQEFTSCGLHTLNSGFTVKWFQSNEDDKVLHSYSTDLTPIQVKVVSLGAQTCP